MQAKPGDEARAARGDATLLNEIADAGFNHSEIAVTAEYLADQIGGRMTNSPAMRKAERWSQDKFRGWGLKNVHTEGFDFGRGWWIESNRVRMVAPRPMELLGIPVAWTPPTNGPVSAPIIVAPMASDKDFTEWKGKLAGKIVLVSWPAPQKDEDTPPTHRFSEVDIVKRDKYEETTYDPEVRVKRIERFRYAAKLDAFLAQEGALASVKMSYRDGRRVHGEGYMYRVGQSPKLPQVELAAEDYRRLTRLAKTGEVKLEIDNKVHYEDADHNAYNVFAEIPGERSEARLRDGRRAPGQLGGRRRRRGQRRGQRHDHGSGAHPRLPEVPAEAHHPLRALVRRGAGPARLGRLRRCAPGEAPAAAGGRGGSHARLFPGQLPGADAAGFRGAVGLFQYRQWLGAPARHLHRGEPVGSCRRSANGWRPSRAWARARWCRSRPVAPTTCT